MLASFVTSKKKIAIGTGMVIVLLDQLDLEVSQRIRARA